MNDQPDIERALRTWFEDGPTEMPDRVVTVVADRIGRQRQRQAWRLSWRLPMNPMLKLAAVVAAVVVLAIVGWNLLPGRSDGVGGAVPTATPTSSPSSTPGAIATPCPTSASACEGPLSPGRHTTNQAITPFTYLVPEGWLKTLDVPGSFNLEAVAAPGGLIAVVPDWAIASQDPCTEGAEPGIGRTVDDLVTWLTTQPGLTATSPEPVTIGGLPGQTLEIVKVPGWTGACVGYVNLFSHADTLADGGYWNITETMKMRLYILTAPAGHTVTIHVETDPRADFDPFVQLATPVVESFSFG